MQKTGHPKSHATVPLMCVWCCLLTLTGVGGDGMGWVRAFRGASTSVVVVGCGNVGVEICIVFMLEKVVFHFSPTKLPSV